MVEFGKKLLRWLVPEWKENYIDYEHLKRIIRDLDDYSLSQDDDFRRKLSDTTLNPPVHPYLNETEKSLLKYPSYYRQTAAIMTFEKAIRHPVIDMLKIDLKRHQSVQIDTAHLTHLEVRNSDQQFIDHFVNEVNKSNYFFCHKFMGLVVQVNDMIKCDEQRQNIQKSELRELYRGVKLLHTFRVLNYTACIKILKKFIKNRLIPRLVHLYLLQLVQELPMVQGAGLFELQMKIEVLFQRVFYPTITSRERLVFVLREKRHARNEIWLSHLNGIGLGFSLALAVLLPILYHQELTKDNMQYTKVFLHPCARLMYVLILTCFLWGLALHIFDDYSINVEYIFEFDSRGSSDLEFVFFSCSLLFAVSLVSIIQLCLFAPPLPVFSVYSVLFLLALLNPCEVCYYKSRVWFLRTCLDIIMTPYYEVQFRHFFLADQFCSILPRILLDFTTTLCFFQYHNPTQCEVGIFPKVITMLFRPLPYIWRFAQCIRRFYVTDNRKHLANAGKYFCSIVFMILVASLSIVEEPSSGLYVICLLCGIIATFYAYAWDVTMDWGLLKDDRWLRGDLLYPVEWYYTICVTNAILRVLWILELFGTYSSWEFTIFQKPYRLLILGLLEALRRGLWNIFRIENEVINNAGEFRALNLTLDYHTKFQTGDLEDLSPPHKSVHIGHKPMIFEENDSNMSLIPVSTKPAQQTATAAEHEENKILQGTDLEPPPQTRVLNMIELTITEQTTSPEETSSGEIRQDLFRARRRQPSIV